jgi:hypothetical protein
MAFGGFAIAQEGLEPVLSDLRSVQANQNASVGELRGAVANVQRIVDDFPASDAAVSVLLGETYAGIDFSAFEQRLNSALNEEEGRDGDVSQLERNEKVSCLATSVADYTGVRMLIGFSTNSTGNLSDLPEIIEPKNVNSEVRLQYLKVVAALEECSPYQILEDGVSYRLELAENAEPTLVAMKPVQSEGEVDLEVADVESSTLLLAASQDTEEGLGLDKQAIRDVQARLLVLGHDPNGVDGAVGKGTRAAIRAWQASVGTYQTGYLNGTQLAALKEQSQSSLEEWLRKEDNSKLYEPPPLLAIGPRNLSGNWRYTTNCGPRSRLGKMKITGNLAIRHAGGQNYTGSLSNSQGFRGRVSATLRGRSVSAVTNFGLLIGKVSLNARVDDYKLVLRGRDSNGCSFYAVKR